MQACTVGVSNAPRIDKSTSRTPMTPNAFCVDIGADRKSTAHRTKIPDSASNATITFLLSALSARIPPKGDRIIVGTIATDNMPAKTAAEPVASKTYIERASFKIKFPNKELANLSRWTFHPVIPPVPSPLFSPTVPGCRRCRLRRCRRPFRRFSPDIRVP